MQDGVNKLTDSMGLKNILYLPSEKGETSRRECVEEGIYGVFSPYLKAIIGSPTGNRTLTFSTTRGPKTIPFVTFPPERLRRALLRVMTRNHGDPLGVITSRLDK